MEMAAREQDPFRKIYISAALLLLAITVGVAGFSLLEHYTLLDALYMTIITISTVGYKEVHPLSDPGKIFAMFLIVTNLGLVTYIVSTVTSFFLDGEFRYHLKIRKMERSISALRGHIILCGYGRNGRAAAQLLSQHNATFVVIERHFTDHHRPQYFVEGDASKEELLLEAGIEHASALITTLPIDAENLYIVLTARQISENLLIISRASDDQAVKKMKIAGADNVIMPDKIGGAHMATLVLSPDVKEFLDMISSQGFDGTAFQELSVDRATTLNELDPWRKTGATILGIKDRHNKYTMNPGYHDKLETGDKIMVMGSKEQIAALQALIK
jgi:voltage-gated potassium channel